MCSGCSGNYAGGFESDDPEDLAPDSREGGTSASLCGERDTDLSGWRGRSAGGFEVLEDAAESCEILVSGTRIIEIRVIPARWHDEDQFGKMRVADAGVPAKHSRAASAKYYQTRHDSAKTDRGRAARSQRISRSLAIWCKNKFRKWLDQARRLLGKCAPQFS